MAHIHYYILSTPNTVGVSILPNFLQHTCAKNYCSNNQAYFLGWTCMWCDITPISTRHTCILIATEFDVRMLFFHLSSNELFNQTIALHWNSDCTQSKNFLITYQSIELLQFRYLQWWPQIIKNSNTVDVNKLEPLW